MATVNENSTAWLSLSLKDRAGEPAQPPQSVIYRIDCLTSGAVIREDTAVTPAGEIELVLTPADNRVIDTSRGSERRRVTVVAAYGEGDQVTGAYDYEVRNLTGVT